MLYRSAQTGIDYIDRLLAWISINMVGDGSSLIVPMFHGIYPDRVSVRSKSFFSQQGMTLIELRLLIAGFERAGFKFIRPDDLRAGLAPDGKYVMLTFDDGYANNLAVLPLLHEFNAPATFFVSAMHAQEGKAFWWDVLYREIVGANRTRAQFEASSAKCKTLRNHEMEAWLKAEFKLQKLLPTGEMDRPMNRSELYSLSKDRFAVIGNHTLDHAILTNYSITEVKEQIEGCQEILREMTGVLPTCIAYPNGNHSSRIVEVARQAGLTSGVGTSQGRNKLPLSSSAATNMSLKRVVPWGDRDIEAQCRVFRSAFSLRNTAVRVRNKLRSGSL